MINNDINYNRTDEELEQFLFFCICVAGKNGDLTCKQVNQFFDEHNANERPFEAVNELIYEDRFKEELAQHGFGQFHRLQRCISEIIRTGLDLRECSIEELEAIHGIGPKTARMFVMFNRPKVKAAILDVHVLRWLRSHRIRAPKQTPSDRKVYHRLEHEFLNLAKRLKKNPAKLDLQIWKSRRRKVG